MYGEEMGGCFVLFSVQGDREQFTGNIRWPIVKFSDGYKNDRFIIAC